MNFTSLVYISGQWIEHVSNARLCPLKLVGTGFHMGIGYHFVELLDKGNTDNDWRQKLETGLGGYAAYERFRYGKLTYQAQSVTS